MTGHTRWADKTLHYRFSDPTLLELALTHRSASKDNYERLEFLGDAFLSLVIAGRLYELRPGYPEGDLSRARASLVRQSTLADIARSLDIDSHVILGRGELRTGAAQRSAILADVFEAVLGAILLDGGHECAEQFVRRVFAERLANLPDPADLKDAKTRLQEWLQSRGLPLPVYTVDEVNGRDHERVYTVVCEITEERKAKDGTHRTSAQARSRRGAEQRAAAMMLAELLHDGE